MIPHDVFAKELLHCNLGRAMWIPEPSHVYGPAQIGDIGYIEEGQFIFLFNASYPPDDPRQKRGVPNEFERLEIPDTNFVDAYLQPQVLHSTTIRQLGANASVSGFVLSFLLSFSHRAIQTNHEQYFLSQVSPPSAPVPLFNFLVPRTKAPSSFSTTP